MRKFISLSFGLLLTFTFIGSASAQYVYTTYNNNGTFCTQDAYVCPNGTTVGRTGSNCQFVCPSTPIPTPANNSYTYTSGCYTYSYNGVTRTTTMVSYNCSNNYNNTYTYPTNYSNYYYTAPTTHYTQPTSYTYPYSYYQYQPTYSNYNYSGYYSYPSGYTDTGYNNYNYNYGNYYNTGYSQSSSCYYLVGIQICY